MIDIRDYSADESSTDNTDAIQAALDTGQSVVVPRGVLEIGDPIVIGAGQHLHLLAGATIIRRDSTEVDGPIIRMTGNSAALSGSGSSSIIESEKASGGESIVDRGVVNVGPVNETQLHSINFWRVSDVCIKGSEADYLAYLEDPYPTDVDANELLTIASSADLMGEGSNYCGRVAGVLIRTGGVGIRLNPLCNGHAFSDLMFHQMTRSCVSAKGCSENSVHGMFCHFSGGVCLVHLEDAHYQHVYGLQGEPGSAAPGGRLSQWCDVDAACSNCMLLGHNNTGHSFANANASSDLVTFEHGQLLGVSKLVASGVELAGELVGTVENLQGIDTRMKASKVVAPSATPDYEELLSLESKQAGNVIQLRISITSILASQPSALSSEWIIHARTDGSNSISASAISVGGDSMDVDVSTSGSVAKVLVRPGAHHNVLMCQAEGIGYFDVKLST